MGGYSGVVMICYSGLGDYHSAGSILEFVTVQCGAESTVHCLSLADTVGKGVSGPGGLYVCTLEIDIWSGQGTALGGMERSGSVNGRAGSKPFLQRVGAGYMRLWR